MHRGVSVEWIPGNILQTGRVHWCEPVLSNLKLAVDAEVTYEKSLNIFDNFNFFIRSSVRVYTKFLSVAATEFHKSALLYAIESCM